MKQTDMILIALAGAAVFLMMRSAKAAPPAAESGPTMRHQGPRDDYAWQLGKPDFSTWGRDMSFGADMQVIGRQPGLLI